MRVSRKLKGITGVLFLAVILVWLVAPSTRPPGSPPVRITFLFATNGPQDGQTWATFRLENRSKEAVSATNGVLERWDGSKWLHGLAGQSTGNYGLTVDGVTTFAAGSTNLFSTWIPTNTGPWRLVLLCYPATATTLAYRQKLRFWAVSKLAELGLMGSEWSDGGYYGDSRMLGVLCPVSQPFQPPYPPSPFRLGGNTIGEREG